jgi:hypothetical protein
MGERLRYEIREADRVLDNEALCRLSLRTPMLSDIDVAIDRSPDFFSFYDLHGRYGKDVPQAERDSGEAQKLDGYTCTVALHEGRLVGALAASHRHVRVDGRPFNQGYPMDARVDPDYQRKGVLTAIAMKLPELYPEVNLDCILSVILRGNKRARKVATEALPEVFLGQPAGEFHLLQFSMYRPYKNRKGLVVEPATVDDLDEIVALLAGFYREHNFAPRMDRAWMDELLRVSKGYTVGDLNVVRHQGRIVALVGLWDQSPIRRMIMLRTTWPVRLGLFAARGLHLVMPSPTPPRRGEAVRSLYIKHIAHAPGHESTLQDLLKVLLNRARRGRQHHFVWGAFFQNSPLLPLFKGFQVTRSHSEVMVAPWNSGWDVPPEEIASKPVYLDYSTV